VAVLAYQVKNICPEQDIYQFGYKNGGGVGNAARECANVIAICIAQILEQNKHKCDHRNHKVKCSGGAQLLHLLRKISHYELEIENKITD
jgi:hypothetical protein